MQLALRTKIFLITTTILVLIQILNNVFEIAFLFGVLEDYSVKKYQTVGKEMKRKLEKSLMFGKRFEQLDYAKLLAGTVPEDLEDFYIVSAEGQVLLVTTEKPESPLVSEEPVTTRLGKDYVVSLPIAARSQVVGNMVMTISSERVQSRLLSIIKHSVVNSLITLGVVLPILYLVLILMIDKPYMKEAKGLARAFIDRDYERLKEHGIDSEKLRLAEEFIRQTTRGDWMTTDRKRLYEQLRMYSQISAALISAKEKGEDPAKAVESITGWEEFVKEVKETENLISEEEVFEIVSGWDARLNGKSKDCPDPEDETDSESKA